MKKRSDASKQAWKWNRKKLQGMPGSRSGCCEENMSRNNANHHNSKEKKTLFLRLVQLLIEDQQVAWEMQEKKWAQLNAREKNERSWMQEKKMSWLVDALEHGQDVRQRLRKNDQQDCNARSGEVTKNSSSALRKKKMTVVTKRPRTQRTSPWQPGLKRREAKQTYDKTQQANSKHQGISDTQRAIAKKHILHSPAKGPARTSHWAKASTNCKYKTKRKTQQNGKW